MAINLRLDPISTATAAFDNMRDFTFAVRLAYLFMMFMSTQRRNNLIYHFTAFHVFIHGTTGKKLNHVRHRRQQYDQLRSTFNLKMDCEQLVFS